MESDFVSGNVSKGYTTPPGLFGLTYKQRDATLKGQGYASPVKFWMPFNGGIGFHDPAGEIQFGGTIYKKSGSHGCINMPYAAAKTLFENVYAGIPVICYNLAGTENSQATKASGKAETAVPVQTTPAEQPTQTPAQTPAETQPAQTPVPTVSPAGPGETTKAQETAAPTRHLPNLLLYSLLKLPLLRKMPHKKWALHLPQKPLQTRSVQVCDAGKH